MILSSYGAAQEEIRILKAEVEQLRGGLQDIVAEYDCGINCGCCASCDAYQVMSAIYENWPAEKDRQIADTKATLEGK